MTANKLANELIDIISDGYDDEEYREEAVCALVASIEGSDNEAELETAIDAAIEILEDCGIEFNRGENNIATAKNIVIAWNSAI